jgi:DNA-binding MarR family transcriptional regulator
MGQWRFLTNHGQALLCIADDPSIRLRDIAAALEITERAAHRIVGELVEDGYVSRKREGRRNRYKVRSHLPLRASLVRDRKVADLLELFADSDGGATRRAAAPSGPKRA